MREARRSDMGVHAAGEGGWSDIIELKMNCLEAMAGNGRKAFIGR